MYKYKYRRSGVTRLIRIEGIFGFSALLDGLCLHSYVCTFLKADSTPINYMDKHEPIYIRSLLFPCPLFNKNFLLILFFSLSFFTFPVSGERFSLSNCLPFFWLSHQSARWYSLKIPKIPKLDRKPTRFHLGRVPLVTIKQTSHGLTLNRVISTWTSQDRISVSGNSQLFLLSVVVWSVSDVRSPI